MSTTTEIKIKGIQHIGIPVTNIKNSIAFYKRLGFSDRMHASFVHERETGLCCMMQYGDIIIELYQLPEKELPDISARKDGHIDHIAFNVDDIDKTYAVLKKKDFKLIEDQPRFLQFWEKGCKYFNIVGPDGEKLEFNQIL